MSKNKKALKYKDNEIYPRSPLAEVVCEIRFPPELSIECRRDEYYNKIKEQYPNIIMPQAKHNQAFSSQPYHFESKDKSSGMMLAINRFSLYQKKYQGHAAFFKEFLRLAKILGSIYSLDRLTRVGWRYVNVIPFTREEGLVPLRRFLSIRINFPHGVCEQFENLGLVLMSKADEGTITTRIETVIAADEQREAILLDFDFSLTRNLKMSKLKGYLEKAHDETRSLFEALITDEYRGYLRGETI